MTIVTVTLNPCVDKSFSVDRIVPDRKLSGSNVHLYPGGGGINVARAAFRLGAEVRALWSCGGRTGQQLGRLLDAETLTHEPVPIENEVRENLMIWDTSTGEQYRFGMPGPELAAADRQRWLRRMGDIPSPARCAVFSGSLPEAASLEWWEALLRAVPEDVPVLVDTKRAALRRALEVGVDLIKPNVHELEELVGREMTDEADIDRAASEIIERGGARVVVVSLGRAGALLATEDTRERFSAPHVHLRTKVGAGDSMVGGLVAALGAGEPLSEAVKRGVAAGAAAVMREGTDLCHRSDAEKLFPRVRRQERGP